MNLFSEQLIVYVRGGVPFRGDNINTLYAEHFNVTDKLIPHENERVNVERIIMQKMFKIRPTLRQSYQNAIAQLGIQGTKYISIHTRIGSGVGDGDDERFRYAANHMEQIAKCLSIAAYEEGRSTGNNVFFLATDTPRFVPYFVRQMKRLESQNKVVVPYWKHTGHVRQLVRSKSMSKSESMRVEDNTFVELLILGNGKHLFILGSKFADLAVSLGSVQSQMLINGRNCPFF